MFTKGQYNIKTPLLASEAKPGYINFIPDVFVLYIVVKLEHR